MVAFDKFLKILFSAIPHLSFPALKKKKKKKKKKTQVEGRVR